MADPAAPPPPSMTPNPVPDQAPDINTQQGEQGRTEAERAAEERRIKENQDNRQLNTVAPTALAAPVINSEGINPSLFLFVASHERFLLPFIRLLASGGVLGARSYREN